MEDLNEYILPVKRPSLLTVLCILTFIGSGWAILGAVTTFKTAGETVALYKKSTTGKSIPNNQISLPADSSLDNLIKDTPASPLADSALKEIHTRKLSQKMEQNLMSMMSVSKLQYGAIGSFIAGIFTLLGGILMWCLKRNGFYLYIAGIVIGIIVPLHIYGNNLLAIGIAGFSSFVGLLFIFLYGLNLKVMR